MMHIVKKKGCGMMTRPVPLMYVRKVPVVYEEASTSIFVKESEADFMDDAVISPIVVEVLQKTQTPFGKHLYRPLVIETKNGETYSGSVEQVEEHFANVKVEETDSLQSIPLEQITNIIWRGTSLLEKG